MKTIIRIAIAGGGPGGLFMFKRLVETKRQDIQITIFEKNGRLGAGMPYSREGAGEEHITNVSGNEIPKLITPLSDWISTVPKDTLKKFHIDPDRFNDYKVLPRLLFGQYLADQFELLQHQATERGVAFEVNYHSKVTDIIDYPDERVVYVEINGEKRFAFDHVVTCTGHHWPVKYEGKVPNFFDSPYPPEKLSLRLDHAVAIKGSSLTAVDAVRTLARHNGIFDRNKDGKLIYSLDTVSPNFKMIMHTRHGMLPAVRFHLEDSHLTNKSLLSPGELAAHIAANGGFLSLDFVFENDFKLPVKEKDPAFYEKIKDMRLEEFVDAMLELREELDPFQLLKAEYAEAEKSIKRRESIYWKEMLGVLSFALNYPAKYLSAEDMKRLKKSLAPLISLVIAYMPQSSSEELIALHDAGVLGLFTVGEDSEVVAVAEGGARYNYIDESGRPLSVYFNTYVNCSGQPHIDFEDFPFKSLITKKTVSPARLKFRNPEQAQQAMAAGEAVEGDENGGYFLMVSGIAVNDHFQVVDEYGAFNNRIYVMAVPYIGGYNPDYSGLDFSEAASAAVIKALVPNDEHIQVA